MGKIKDERIGNTYIQRKRNVIYEEDNVIKKVLTANITSAEEIDKWLQTYEQLYQYDNRIVKVYDIVDNTIIMEKIEYKYGLDQYVKTYDPDYTHEKLNHYISQFMDIWNNFFQFSFKHLKDYYFFHKDYKVANIVVDYDDNLRVIDPDSYKLENIFGFVETGLYAENLIRLTECRRFHKSDHYWDSTSNRWEPHLLNSNVAYKKNSLLE